MKLRGSPKSFSVRSFSLVVNSWTEHTRIVVSSCAQTSGNELLGFADVSQEDESRHHFPLRDKRTRVAGDFDRVKNDLTSLSDTLRRHFEMSRPTDSPLAKFPPPASPVAELELELESQILLETHQKTMVGSTEVTTSAPQIPQKMENKEGREVVEEIIVPTRVTRPKSQEMCTQTVDEPELDAQTREYLKEKERMTVAMLEVLRKSMSPLPPPPLPQTVEKETQFEEVTEQPCASEKVDRDADTQTISERHRSFETQTEEIVTKTTVQINAVDEALTETSAILQQQNQHQLPQRPVSGEYVAPMFVQPLRDLVVNEGDKVVLECK